MSNLADAFDQLRHAIAVLHRGATRGTEQGFVVGQTVLPYTPLLNENAHRVKLIVQNIDAPAGNPVEIFYSAERLWGNGRRIYPGDCYIDDSLRCYRGPLFARIDPAIFSLTTVPIRVAEEVV